MLLDATHIKEGFPKYYYDAKRLVMRIKSTRRCPRMLMRSHLKVETSPEGELDKDQST